MILYKIANLPGNLNSICGCGNNLPGITTWYSEKCRGEPCIMLFRANFLRLVEHLFYEVNEFASTLDAIEC